MPANIPSIPEFIQMYLDQINGARRTAADTALADKTGQLERIIQTVRNLHQSQGVMGISPESANLIEMQTSLLSQHGRPMKALDIGTFTGGSALAMARGMTNGGKVISCDIDNEGTKEPLKIAKEVWEAAGVSDRIELRLAPANETLDKLLAAGEKDFDIVFIDADKTGYKEYYEKALKLLRPGGLIIFDNMLWSGRVAVEGVEELGDPATTALKHLNEYIAVDERVHAVLLGHEDGTMIVRKLDPNHFRDRAQRSPASGIHR